MLKADWDIQRQKLMVLNTAFFGFLTKLELYQKCSDDRARDWIAVLDATVTRVVDLEEKFPQLDASQHYNRRVISDTLQECSKFVEDIEHRMQEMKKTLMVETLMIVGTAGVINLIVAIIINISCRPKPATAVA